MRLYRTFDIDGGITDPCEGLVVIVENQGRKVGLLVDELLGQLQVVMKSVEENYQKVDGICGATILGDGRVALIIDIAGVDRLSREACSQAPAPPAACPSSPPAPHSAAELTSAAAVAAE